MFLLICIMHTGLFYSCIFPMIHKFFFIIGLSYRNEVNFTSDTKSKIFLLPILPNQVSVYVLYHVLLLNVLYFIICSGIPSALEADIEKYFYRCVARLAAFEAAFINPTKVSIASLAISLLCTLFPCMYFSITSPMRARAPTVMQ